MLHNNKHCTMQHSEVFSFFFQMALLSVGICQSYDSCERKIFKGAGLLKCNNLGWRVLPPKIPSDVSVLMITNQILETIDYLSLKSNTLTNLRLSGCQIRRLTSNQFSGLPNLGAVDLSNNTLTGLPESVFNPCKELRFLNLSRNAIHVMDEKVFVENKNLVVLDFSRNYLTHLNNNTFKSLVKLQYIDLSYNKLRAIGDHALAGLPKLTSLHLSHNELEKLPSTFVHYVSKLVVLHLDYNNLTTFPWLDYMELSKSVLLVLNLHSNQITNVPLVFVQNVPLIEFSIGENPLICDCSMDWIRQVERKASNSFQATLQVNMIKYYQPDKKTVKCAGPGIYSDGYPWDFETLCDIDECKVKLHPCAAHSTCYNTAGDYECKCNVGFYGYGKIKCTDVNECEVHSAPNIEMLCSKNANCVNTFGSYDCKCKKGFVGDGFVCDDINECSDNKLSECPAGAQCVNTIGSYVCRCEPGYHIQNGECRDIDECLEDHSCEKKCYNTMGSYLCNCKAGYRYAVDGECYDINECLIKDMCHTNAGCINTEGSYICRCKRGFLGDGRKCKDVNECYIGLHRCHPNASCTNTIGSHKCSCKVGYIGDGVYKCMPEHDVVLQEVKKKITTNTPFVYNQNSQQGLVNTLGGVIGLLVLIAIILTIYITKPKFLSTSKLKEKKWCANKSRKSVVDVKTTVNENVKSNIKEG
ncbi:slit homolog 1 protein-like [Hydractinia symbiolongicarpus]|uniref:slit homolog 1 protein-like n=1 Tax=Hydractinia symbiolongicarpus TaxID=13093 RepID=UPI00254E74E6|nr:slit homolog 1 protein-like [Hydractinia symbiolongicarpus]